jgi:hypothetical protein
MIPAAAGRTATLALLLALLPAAGVAQHRPTPLASWTPAAPLPGTDWLRQADFGVPDPGPLQEDGRRYTKRGLVIGAIAGAVAGLGIGAFIAVFCESEGDDCGAVVPVVTAIGIASGAAAGAIIGAAIPRPPQERPAADTVPATADTPRRRTIGSLSAAAGVAHAVIDDGVGEFRGSGPFVRVNLAAELRPWLAIGPEVGKAWFDDGGAIRHGALAVRGTWARPHVAPYAAVNLGAYQTTGPSLEFLGGGLGIGARITPLAGRRLFLDIEGRASRHMQNIAPMRMLGLSLGGGLAW